MKLKIGHCQLRCTAGDYAANRRRVLAGLDEAASEDLDILSFPECYLSGYFRSAEQARQHSFRVDGPEIADLLRRTARYPTTLIVGFNELRGDEIYDTVLVASRQCSSRQSRVRHAPQNSALHSAEKRTPICSGTQSQRLGFLVL